MRGLGLTGGSLDVVLSVYNPNHYRLDATRLTYQVLLNVGDSVTLASGTLDKQFTVQENDSAVVTIPVNFTYAGVGAAGEGAAQHGCGDLPRAGRRHGRLARRQLHRAVLVDGPVHDDGSGPLDCGR